jgi:hypothetical protein
LVVAMLAWPARVMSAIGLSPAGAIGNLLGITLSIADGFTGLFKVESLLGNLHDETVQLNNIIITRDATTPSIVYAPAASIDTTAPWTYRVDASWVPTSGAMACTIYKCLIQTVYLP